MIQYILIYIFFSYTSITQQNYSQPQWCSCQTAIICGVLQYKQLHLVKYSDSKVVWQIRWVEVHTVHLTLNLHVVLVLCNPRKFHVWCNLHYTFFSPVLKVLVGSRWAGTQTFWWHQENRPEPWCRASSPAPKAGSLLHNHNHHTFNAYIRSKLFVCNRGKVKDACSLSSSNTPYS